MREASSVHVTFAPEDRMGPARRARLPAAQRPAIPLGERRLRDVRRFPRRARGAQAQGDPARARRRAGKRHRGGLADRQATSPKSVWDAFFAFYMETGSRKWGRPYLTRKFYSLIGETMADKVLLVMAKRAGRYHRGRDQLHRRRHALRPPLGRGRAPPVPAFRAVLLSGDRFRDPQQARRGSRPARRASTSWRAATCR